MSEYILKLVIAVVAAAMILCSQSVTCEDRQIRNHQFQTPPLGRPIVYERQYDGYVDESRNYDFPIPGVAICKSQNDEGKALAACQNLSDEYTGKCEVLEMEFSYTPLRKKKWTAICYSGNVTIGCISNHPSNTTTHFIYWTVEYAPLTFDNNLEQQYFCRISRSVGYRYVTPKPQRTGTKRPSGGLETGSSSKSTTKKR